MNDQALQGRAVSRLPAGSIGAVYVAWLCCATVLTAARWRRNR